MTKEPKSRLQVEDTTHTFRLSEDWQKRYGLMEHAELRLSEPGTVTIGITVAATGFMTGTLFGGIGPDVSVYEAAARDPAGFLERYIRENADQLVAEHISNHPDAPRPEPPKRMRKVNRSLLK